MSDSTMVIPGLAWVDFRRFGERGRQPDPQNYYAVDPAPVASFVAAVIGLRDDLNDCMKAIAEDEVDGPIHLIHILAACEAAAQDVRGGLPSDGSIPAALETHGGFITATVSPEVLPNLVRTLRGNGIAAATALARTYSRRERYRALDVLVHFVAAPIINLKINVDDERVRDRS